MHEEPLLTVDEVATRLNIPVGLLVNRIKAGDVHAESVPGPDGPAYLLRLGDLGVEPDDPAASAVVEAHGERAASVFGDRSAGSVAVATADEISGRFRDYLTLDVAGVDSRAVVAELFDRWERTMSRQVYAENRQRYEAELAVRQNLVRQLQLEMQVIRAEGAAALAAKDLEIAGRERHLEDRERHLAERERELAARQAPAKRWTWRVRF